MRANVLTDWKMLEMKDVPAPKPAAGQALIEVVYAGICGSDVTVFNHNHPTATVPRIMCHEILGIVREIKGGDPVPYKVGSRAVVFPLSYCGKCDPCRDGNFHVCTDLRIMGLHLDGGFAEYVCADAEKVFPISDDIPDRIAILTEPLAVGFHANARAGTEPGDTVLVIGAGPIGILCAMCARYFEASKVALAEINPERIALARSFGFDVIDSKGDVLKEILARTGGKGFDKVFEASGSQAGALMVAAAAKIRGVIVPIGIPHQPMPFEVNKIILKEQHIVGSRVHTLKHFGRSVEMVERFHRNKTFDLERMIAATYPLGELAGHRHAGFGKVQRQDSHRRQKMMENAAVRAALCPRTRSGYVV